MPRYFDNAFSLVVLLLIAGCLNHPPVFAREFTVLWTDSPCTIDGRAQEPEWQQAELIDRFATLGAEIRTPNLLQSTRARLLWDRQYLYFLAQLDDSDVVADASGPGLAKPDDFAEHADIFELYLKPAEDKPGYYVIQVSAAAVVTSRFLSQRGEPAVVGAEGRPDPSVEAMVTIDGTRNQGQDRDNSWTVEGRIPWTDLLTTGGRPDVGHQWRVALCRRDSSTSGGTTDLSASAALTGPDFHRHEDYDRISFAGPDPAAALRPYGIARRTPLLTSEVVGSPTPPPPYRVAATLPELHVKYPVFVASEPGSRRLIFIDERWNYGPTRILRSGDDPQSGETEVLLDRGELNEVAYSICFHPRYSENGYLYVGSNLQEVDQPKQCRITRYTVSRQPPYQLDPNSEVVILQWASDGHNGAAMTFGLDGLMYVTTGDGTSSSDSDVVGQTLDHLLAKVLRIDVDHPTQGQAYSIPADNPFVGRADASPETWAYGLRNPWRITTDQRTGAIWIAQNGQDLWEQIYVLQRAANYGWSAYEGSYPFIPARLQGPSPLTLPTFEHAHSEARSLTGGVVYYGTKFPELAGAYVYGDYSTGKIWAGRIDAVGKVTWHQEIADSNLQLTSIGTDADGELLLTDHQPQTAANFYTLELNPADDEPVTFPTTLSASGLFTSVAEHRMAPGVIPYDVNSPLWSDAAIKSRYLAIPESAARNGGPPEIGFDPHHSWDFPDGTVLVKSFALELKEGDLSSRRWVETRFLTRHDGEWAGYSYRWNDEQTDAVLVAATGADREYTIQTAAGVRRQTWRYPSRTECMVCHTRAARFVLGLSTAQLNREFDYRDAGYGEAADNQLRVLEALGLLKVDWHSDATAQLKNRYLGDGMNAQEADQALQRMVAGPGQRQPVSSHLLARSPDEYDRLADPYAGELSVSERARSYLHVNCAHCHVDSGGGNANFDLNYRRKQDEMNVIGVPALHETFDLADPRLIAPGFPERSVLLHRVSIRGRGQMPQLATDLVDEAAVQLLRDWIADLRPDSD